MAAIIFNNNPCHQKLCFVHMGKKKAHLGTSGVKYLLSMMLTADKWGEMAFITIHFFVLKKQIYHQKSRAFLVLQVLESVSNRVQHLHNQEISLSFSQHRQIILTLPFFYLEKHVLRSGKYVFFFQFFFIVFGSSLAYSCILLTPNIGPLDNINQTS